MRGLSTNQQRYSYYEDIRKFRRNQTKHNLVIEAVLVIIIMQLKQMLDRRNSSAFAAAMGCHALALEESIVNPMSGLIMRQRVVE